MKAMTLALLRRPSMRALRASSDSGPEGVAVGVAAAAETGAECFATSDWALFVISGGLAPFTMSAILPSYEKNVIAEKSKKCQSDLEKSPSISDRKQ